MANGYTKKVGETWFGVALENERVYATSFGPTEKVVLQNLRKSVPNDLPLDQVKSPSKFADQVIAVMKNVYDGKGFLEDLSFEMNNLSNYTKRVIEAVCQIPPGYVASYGGVARAVGGSSRAVGRVMALNPFAPLCPCHRVVRSDFTLGGYGGGLNVKLEFLKRERRGYSSKKAIQIESGKLELFPVEFAVKTSTGTRQLR